MKLYYKYGLIIGVLVVAVILSIIVGDKWYMPIPVPGFLGVCGVAFLFAFSGIAEYCRGKTDQIIFNHGHTSIRHRDLHHIPWHETITDEKGNKKSFDLGTITIALTGGIDYWGFTLRGGPEQPVLIFPSTYEVKEENNYHSYTNLIEYKWNELPSYIRQTLMLWPKRVRPGSTPILFGYTSHLDGSATPENLKIELLKKEENKAMSMLESVNEKLYEQLKKFKEANKETMILRPAEAVSQD